MDFSKVFAEHDETLLYIFYTMTDETIKLRSAVELCRRGWLFDESDQTWHVTRKASSKGNKPNKPNTREGVNSEDGTELRRYKFDIDQWNLVEFSLSDHVKRDTESQKRFEELNSLQAD
jgi:hypothetical protein